MIYFVATPNDKKNVDSIAESKCRVYLKWLFIWAIISTLEIKAD